jgi:hypothetical protein
MAIGNAALFKSGEPVMDLNIDLFLRKQETSQYHVELLLRDLRTTEYPVLFGGRRGPKFLPRSLFESANDEASMSLREPRRKRPKPDPSQQLPPDTSPEEGEEADSSSMASEVEEESTPKRHKLHHHRPHHKESAQHSQATSTNLQSKSLAESSRKESGSMLSSFRKQLLQVSFCPIHIRFCSWFCCCAAARLCLAWRIFTPLVGTDLLLDSTTTFVRFPIP